MILPPPASGSGLLMRMAEEDFDAVVDEMMEAEHQGPAGDEAAGEPSDDIL